MILKWFFKMILKVFFNDFKATILQFSLMMYGFKLFLFLYMEINSKLFLTSEPAL